MAMQAFVAKWKFSSSAERANSQSFLGELCDALDLPRPDPSVADEIRNTYVFEKLVYFKNADGSNSFGWIDLYRKGSFVLESKQGSEGVSIRRGTAVRGTAGWDQAMLKALAQAERYAKALPVEDGWPPFLITVDVGHSIELYADFSLTGKAYLPFPDARTHRIRIDALTEPAIVERLRAVWLDPLSLDPTRRTAKVTREVAEKLAVLARDLEHKHSPEAVAQFLMRCIFTSFAQSVGLLPPNSWVFLLESLREDVDALPGVLQELWAAMNAGTFSAVLRKKLLRFNGGLFAENDALPLATDQLNRLIEAARADWRDVEPAIFGTLLERALNKNERHRLGAHYTPRAYVERLVIPTLVEPLRDDWRTVQAAASDLQNSGDITAAIALVREFHEKLCNTRVLDPACGTGNFLYVSLEHMKRLEGEVLNALHDLGESQQVLEHTGLSVNPEQLLGIEVNPRAAAITDLVLWIGYLQWHFRTRGDTLPAEPVIRNFHNIECRDALVTWSAIVPLKDKQGNEVTQWDGVTRKKNPLTGEEIPDDSARRTVVEYRNPRKAKWPEASFIIGNPPFIGGKDIRQELGDGYTHALRSTWDDVPESADYVLYWWNHAAELARAGRVRRFGFITTNSLPQVFNRRVVAAHRDAAKNPLSLIFAIPDHPWYRALSDEEQARKAAAAVRIAMTVGERGSHDGHLFRVVRERATTGDGVGVDLAEQTGRIFSDLRIGVNVAGATALEANEGLCNPGVKLHGSGFIITPEKAAELGLGRIAGLEKHIRNYRNGRDLTGTSRNKMAIDLYGLSIEHVRLRFPEVYQHVLDTVKVERDQNRRSSYAQNWWIFGEARSELRLALRELTRYIATVETAKHRTFSFLDASILPDNMLVNIASDDAFVFGVLSSNVHVRWALAAGGTLEDRPRYNKTRCFDPFPLPACDEQQKARIRELGERLDAHRKRQQELHPTLTLTEMYNVLDTLRAGNPLSEEERAIYHAGLIGVLRELHDELDRAVLDAYGWPRDLNGQAMLERVVALNAQRHAEEQRGIVRWLRPAFQAPESLAVQTAFLRDADLSSAAATRTRRQSWPTHLPEQVRAIKDALRFGPFQTSAALAAQFTRARRSRVDDLLSLLVSLGQLREEGGRYSL